ncbi:hypothetical protein MMPV_001824 [Pyropia vietnamensis]
MAGPLDAGPRRPSVDPVLGHSRAGVPLTGTVGGDRSSGDGGAGNRSGSGDGRGGGGGELSPASALGVLLAGLPVLERSAATTLPASFSPRQPFASLPSNTRLQQWRATAKAVLDASSSTAVGPQQTPPPVPPAPRAERPQVFPQATPTDDGGGGVGGDGGSGSPPDAPSTTSAAIVAAAAVAAMEAASGEAAARPPLPSPSPRPWSSPLQSGSPVPLPVVSLPASPWSPLDTWAVETAGSLAGTAVAETGMAAVTTAGAAMTASGTVALASFASTLGGSLGSRLPAPVRVGGRAGSWNERGEGGHAAAADDSPAEAAAKESTTEAAAVDDGCTTQLPQQR